MKLDEDYKNIVKLRFDNFNDLSHAFFNEFYNFILYPETFSKHVFDSFSLKDTLYYLQKSHLEYLNIWLPKIERIVDEIQQDIGTNELTLTLNTFLVNYQNELSNHINFEEKVLYNFATKLLKGVYVESEKIFVLNHFLETHSHTVEESLLTIQKRLRNIDSKKVKSNLFKTLFSTFNLMYNDLKIHGLIEDEVFINKMQHYIDKNF